MVDLKRATRCYSGSSDILLAILGALHFSIGVVAFLRQQQYLEIVDNNGDFNLVMIFHIALGVATVIISLIKAVTSCCPGENWYNLAVQIGATIGMFTVKLLALVLGIVVATKNGDVFEQLFFESSTQTFLDYSVTQSRWDPFQSTFQCCGVSGASDYALIFNNPNTVPESCCNLAVVDQEGLNCSDVAANLSPDHLIMNRIFNQGCVDAVISQMTYNYVLIAGGSIGLFIAGLGWFVSVIFTFFLLWCRDDSSTPTTDAVESKTTKGKVKDAYHLSTTQSWN